MPCFCAAPKSYRMRSTTLRLPSSCTKTSAANERIASCAPAGAARTSAARRSTAFARTSGPEADGRCLALLGAVELEVLALLEPELRRHQVRGKALAAGIEIAHHRVVVAARVLDGVLERGELALERHERLVGLELRVGLGHREQRADGLRE